MIYPEEFSSNAMEHINPIEIAKLDQPASPEMAEGSDGEASGAVERVPK